jgi:ABC-type branched-subunit amino acid transport system ATPase component
MQLSRRRMEILELKGVTKRFGEVVSVDNVSLTLTEGGDIWTHRPKRRGQNNTP